MSSPTNPPATDESVSAPDNVMTETTTPTKTHVSSVKGDEERIQPVEVVENGVMTSDPRHGKSAEDSHQGMTNGDSVRVGPSPDYPPISPRTSDAVTYVALITDLPQEAADIAVPVRHLSSGICLSASLIPATRPISSIPNEKPNSCNGEITATMRHAEESPLKSPISSIQGSKDGKKLLSANADGMSPSSATVCSFDGSSQESFNNEVLDTKFAFQDDLRRKRKRRCFIATGAALFITAAFSIWLSRQKPRGNINFVYDTLQPTRAPNMPPPREPISAPDGYFFVQSLEGPQTEACDGMVKTKLSKPIRAQVVRLKISSFVNWPSMKVQFRKQNGSEVEFVSSRATSAYDSSCAPDHIAIPFENECDWEWSWCGAQAEEGDIIEFDFGKPVSIGSIVMQGRNVGEQWGFITGVDMFAAWLIGERPTSAPTPSLAPTRAKKLTLQPTRPDSKVDYRYEPGMLNQMKEGVRLSKGLDIKVIARRLQQVPYANGEKSSDTFHERPDYGSTFPVPDDDLENPGGWVYTSNSEMDDEGGVGAITFNSEGEVIKYASLQKGTTRNCGGGKTPWGTFVSCEEPRSERVGQCYEIDPHGRTGPRKTKLGRRGGIFESFSYDVRDKENPAFFVTEDYDYGALRRFIPSNPDWDNPTEMLHGRGTFDYLVLNPSKVNSTIGTFEWVEDKSVAEESAFKHYRNSEGIDAYDGELYFVSKKFRELFILDLDAGTYEVQSTQSGHFDGDPDQMARIIGEEEMVYFTENGGEDAGIHGRDSRGRYFTILESPVYKEETTGLAFSPDYMHMYLAYQMNGFVFDVTRMDGLPFNGKTFNLQYHKIE